MSSIDLMLNSIINEVDFIRNNFSSIDEIQLNEELEVLEEMVRILKNNIRGEYKGE